MVCSSNSLEDRTILPQKNRAWSFSACLQQIHNLAHIPCCSLGSYCPKTVELSSSKLSAHKHEPSPLLFYKALWLVLEKYGIPPLIVRLIQSLHNGMKVEVSVDGITTPVIEVNKGLRQGCTIAPSLLNLYFNLVMEEWRREYQPFGTEML